MVPRVEFETGKLVNQFCHISVVYADQMPEELASGILRNKTYLDRYARFRLKEHVNSFQRAGMISSSSWYRCARELMRGGDKLEPSTSSLNREKSLGVFLDLLQKPIPGFDETWATIHPRMEKYMQNFSIECIDEMKLVLARLSKLVDSAWRMSDITVHLVDCLNGGFAWQDSIALYPFPDFDVEKKLLAHELSELITPSGVIGGKLAEAGLDPGIAHTVVDMVAYFGVRDFIKNLDRKGIRPNPNYYQKVGELYPLFEEYSRQPSNFAGFVDRMVSGLKQKSIA